MLSLGGVSKHSYFRRKWNVLGTAKLFPWFDKWVGVKRPWYVIVKSPSVISWQRVGHVVLVLSAYLVVDQTHELLSRVVALLGADVSQRMSFPIRGWYSPVDVEDENLLGH